MTTVLIQPHPDDLAYSIGGILLLDEVLIDKDNTIAVTVFTGSSSAKKVISDITQVRREENRKYFNSLHLPSIDLHHPDSSFPYRNMNNTMEVYNLMKRELNEIIGKEDKVVMPLAIGYHIDHLMVRDALESFPNKVYYEDVPYIFRYGPKLLKDKRVYEYDISLVLNKKIELLKIYDSQMDETTLQQVKQKTIERLWI